MFSHIILSNDGREVLGYANNWQLAWRLAEVYRAQGIACVVRRNPLR